MLDVIRRAIAISLEQDDERLVTQQLMAMVLTMKDYIDELEKRNVTQELTLRYKDRKGA